MNYWQALILGIIEGLTEYLPVSSTGHLVIAGLWLHLPETDFLKAFNVIIQLGAIAAVVLVYFKKLISSKKFLLNLVITIAPTLIIGFALKTKVDEWLGSPKIIGYALIVGGIIFFWLDRFFKDRSESDLTLIQRISLGVFQSLALIPGVSRSGATLMGGAFFSLSRKEAAEYSFLMGAPTIAAAALYKIVKIRHELTMDNLGLLVFGSLVSFVFAWGAIRLFISSITKYGLKPFAYYRIALGVILLWSL